MRVMDKTILQRIEEYNVEFQKKHGRTPSYRQIMNDLSIGSLATVQRYVLALEREGRITRSEIGTIMPVPQLKPKGVTITPLVGSIACGQLTFAVEDIEGSYALPKEIFGNGELFMLHATGDSMIEAEIGQRRRWRYCCRHGGGKHDFEEALSSGKENHIASGKQKDAGHCCI